MNDSLWRIMAAALACVGLLALAVVLALDEARGPAGAVPAYHD